MHTRPMQATLERAMSNEITASQRFGQTTVTVETTWGVSNKIVVDKTGKHARSK